MTNLTPEMKRVMASLRARLNKKSDVDDSPLWNVVAAHLNATLISVEGGFRGERDLQRGNGDLRGIRQVSKVENSAYEEVVGRSPDGDGGTHLVAGLLPGPFWGPLMGERTHRQLE